MLRTIIQTCLAITLVMPLSSAGAAIITFDSLTGANGDAFSSTSEAGYDVTAVTNAWNEAHVFGNPVPSIFTSGTQIHTVAVTETGGGLFSLNSVDFGCGGGAVSSCIGSVEGLLGGILQFSTSTAPLTNNGTFTTFLAGVSAFAIDTLRISIDQTDSNIDNINLAAGQVPVPTSVLLLSLGLLGMRRQMKPC